MIILFGGSSVVLISNQDALEVQTIVAMMEWCVNNYIPVHCRPAALGVRKQLTESWVGCV